MLQTATGIWVPEREIWAFPKWARPELLRNPDTRNPELVKRIKEWLGIGVKAIAEAALDSGTWTAGSTSKATSYTGTATSLQLCFVNSSNQAAGAQTPTLSGFTQVATLLYGAVSDRRVTLFRDMSNQSNPSIDWSAVGQDAGSYSICEFSGVDTTGSDGSGAVKQSATNSSTAVTAGGTLVVTLSAFSDGGNATYGGFGSVSTISVELGVGSGFTLIHDVGDTGGFLFNALTEYKLSNDTTVDCVNNDTVSEAIAGIAVEISVPAGGIGAMFIQVRDFMQFGMRPS